MPGEDFMSWSVTAASNANADAGINWQENQPRNSVNNSARSMMAAMAKDRKLRNGGYITTGTANAQIITSDVGYTAGAAPTGIIVRPKVGPALTNTGPMTLQLDATTAAPVKDLLGGDVMSGNWIAGSYPEVIFDGTNWLLIGSVVGWATGDIKLTYKSVADDGWIMMDDGSIGDATSGGTTRANADTLGLFTLFYASPFTDATAPIQTSSGAATTRAAQGAAATAYATHCRLVLPATKGRALSAAGAGSGLTAHTLGSTFGSEASDVPGHSHGISFDDIGIPGGDGSSGSFIVSHLRDYPLGTGVVVSQQTSVGGTNVSPSIYLNVMIKL